MQTADPHSPTPRSDQPGGVPDEYAKIIDLHKFYLEMGTRMTAWGLAIVGAILTYVSQHAVSERTVQLALLVPLVLCIGNAVLFLGSIGFARDFMLSVDAVQARLHVSWRPHIELIVGMSASIGVLFFVLAIALAVLMVSPHWILGAFPRA
jgi:hypothetical protein